LPLAFPRGIPTATSTENLDRQPLDREDLYRKKSSARRGFEQAFDHVPSIILERVFAPLRVFNIGIMLSKQQRGRIAVGRTTIYISMKPVFRLAK
jgi:hypothetical protein